MKYSGHESFSIRKDWLAKGIRKFDAFKKDELSAMDELGIGKNMVKSLRYWLRVTGITDDDPKKKNSFKLSELGDLINKKDPYTEELGTLWILQYNLAKNIDNATSWYFFFNEFDLSEFNAQDYYIAIKKWDEMNNPKPASESSLTKDFDCIKRTYLHRSALDDIGKNEDFGPESNMECPFTELGLLEKNDKGLYKKSSPSKQSIPLLIVLAVIIKQAGEQKEIKLSDLQNQPNSVGKVFNLDTILLISLLSDLENKGYVKVVRTAGLDVLRITTDLSYLNCIEKYYKDMENE